MACMGLPHLVVAVGVTFLCGLIPVVGNLMSNTLVVAIGFMVTPAKGLWALAFLVLIHQLEYLLNGKIIGTKIHTSVWMTLMALLLGERLMGITGMVLAPVLLHYIRIEASKISVNHNTEKGRPDPALTFPAMERGID
jgi:predicted PurR-regulated permease PerM